MTNVENLFNLFLSLTNGKVLKRFDTDTGCLWVANASEFTFEVWSKTEHCGEHGVIMSGTIVKYDAINN
jgi:hypothetical protein